MKSSNGAKPTLWRRVVNLRVIEETWFDRVV